MTPTLEKAARAVQRECLLLEDDECDAIARAVLQAIRPRDGGDLPLSEIMARKYIDRILNQ